MIHAEKKFEELRQGLDMANTSNSHAKIESDLRLAWRESHAQQQEPEKRKKTWTWNMLSYALTGSSLAAMAVITTFLVQPGATPPTSSTQTKAYAQKEDVASPTSSLPVTPPYEGELYLETGDGLDADVYAYKKNEETAQLFNESVILAIDVKGNTLDVIHKLREQVSIQQGYLLDISYHTAYGTLDIKLPADQLSVFEDTLKELDVNHEVEVTDYVVQNISQQIVTLDESMLNIQEKIDADKAKLNETNLTQTERQTIQTRIIEQEESIQALNSSREEKIATYELISVRVVISQYSSFWEGDYYQYDRSTVSGMVKYETSRALYTLVRSGSTVLRLVVWLAIYSVLLIPAFLVLRKVVRAVYAFIISRR